MQFWMTLAISLLMLGVCSVNGQEAVLNDTCEACEITCGSGSGQTTLSCKDIYDADNGHKNEAYTLHVNSEQIPVYCHMVKAKLEECGGGGWTLVMKINGDKDTFHYDSKLWTNKNELNPLGGKTLLDHQETKLPTYWSTPFSKICLAMKIDSQVKSIVIYKTASSLYALIADGTQKNFTQNLGRQAWKDLIGQNASLQTHCNREGFNLKSPHYHSEARIGIVSNQEDDCVTPDSRIGFGIGGYPNGHNTCGNVASAGYHPDNGVKDIKAMGYILVQ
ncbi:uncharacterized skeletal organic matrix protein 5-like isoform X2 [Porites lutea]